ncbi:hypothetical protein BKA64DRAFT_651982 [Cadophora sp. MPI-SDFR-AT-0126]|nr:hypothetical protein BKA64DRAFT_651982 [Leotiomycetes sp. MPI-SDFR-AT-0126]
MRLTICLFSVVLTHIRLIVQTFFPGSWFLKHLHTAEEGTICFSPVSIMVHYASLKATFHTWEHVWEHPLPCISKYGVILVRRLISSAAIKITSRCCHVPATLLQIRLHVANKTVLGVRDALCLPSAREVCQERWLLALVVFDKFHSSPT